jgi:lipopolysaccharide export system permease protein
LRNSFAKVISHFSKFRSLIKKLDILIVRSFVGPFIATFFITLFVLLVQFFWLWIDDLVGKGLDVLTIGKFIGFVSATLVPLALPLAVLLSSIMTFGNLGERFELVAIKSAGISLLRFMRPLFLVTLIICGISFLFNNYIDPVVNLKMQTMRYDIVVAKPAFDIKEGVFYDKIEGYIIKIGKKEKDNSTIENVLIYEQPSSSNNSLQDNIIVAERGKMSVTPDNFLEFDLQNGWLYQETGQHMTTNTEFVRIGFKYYKKVFDLSSFKLTRSSDNTFKNNYQMLNIRQLTITIDSLKKKDKESIARTNISMNQQLSFPKYIDSNWTQVKSKPVGKAKIFKNLLPDSVQSTVFERSASVVNSIRNIFDENDLIYADQQKQLRLHQVAWHDKLTMSLACLVLFLIGAPLGSIIQKGGVGLPLVFAVVFFVIFYLLNNYGSKFVKEGVMTPIAGMWLATYVLLPIGIFLTYKALHDSQLFNREFYFRSWKRLKIVLEKMRSTPPKEDSADMTAS